MKQSIKNLLVIALALVAFKLDAQVRINPKAGINISALDTRLENIRAEARTGWNAGMDFHVGRGFFFFNPGLHYYNFSADLKENINSPGDFGLEDQTTIQQLKMPINVGLNFGLFGLNVRGGVTPSYLLGVKEGQTLDLTEDDLKNFTMGANVGAGVKLLFLTIDANYEIGLTDFFEGSSGKNNVFTLSAGLKF